jgi:polar amino acid transport system substrate-binding protein
MPVEEIRMRLLFLSLFMMGMTVSTAMAMQEVKICMVENFPGHIVSRYVLKHAYEQAGIPVVFLPLPNRRSLDHANTGICDGELARIAKATEKYSNLRVVPTQLRNIQAFAYKKKASSISVRSWEDLASLDIAIVRGELYAANYTKQYSPRVVKDYATLFRMLHSEGVDVAVGLRVSAIGALSLDARSDEIERLNDPLFEVPIYHLLHKDKQPLNDLLNSVLIDMQKTGRLEKLTNEGVAMLAAGKL